MESFGPEAGVRAGSALREPPQSDGQPASERSHLSEPFALLPSRWEARRQGAARPCSKSPVPFDFGLPESGLSGRRSQSEFPPPRRGVGKAERFLTGGSRNRNRPRAPEGLLRAGQGSAVDLAACTEYPYSSMPAKKKTTASQALVPLEVIERRILLLRGHKVMLDSHLAELYQVETKVLNQAVRRNADRFPEDFMFRLSTQETDALRSQIVTSKNQFPLC